MRSIKRKKAAVALVAAIVIIAMIAVSISSGSSSAVTTEIKETQAKTGNVAKTISASGSLSDDASINIKVPAGVILNDILVSEGDTVKKGDVLAKVDPASAAKAILELEEEQDEIEDAIDSLSTPSDTTSDDYLKKIIYDEELSDIASAISKLRDMLDTGMITATKSGTITSVNAEEGEAVSAASVSSKAESSSENSAGTKTMSTAITGTGTSYSITTANVISTGSQDSTSYLSGKEALLAAVTEAETETGEKVTYSDITLASTDQEETSGAGTEEEDTDESDKLITNDDLVTLLVSQPQAGAIPQQRVASTSKYDSRITWNTNTTFQAGKTYTAVIELTSKNGYSFSNASSYDIEIDEGTLIAGTPKVTGSGSGNKLVLKVSFTLAKESAAGSNANKESKNDIVSSDSASDKASSNAGNTASSGNSGSGASRSTGSSRSSAGSSAASSSASTTDSDSLVESSVDMITCFSMSSDDEMTVIVSVDETDINSVKTGQTASITLDAVEGENFDGEITKVSQASSSSSGGNVKYQVTITLDKTEDMKSGMTAAAVINIEEANNVIVIPSAAINEKNGETYVYTKKDGDELSGEVAVTTGLSNGNMVEVTSGLEEGDTVYYEIRTKDSSSGGDSDKRGGMQNMGNGMPSDMPQGGHGEGNSQGRPGGDGNNGGSN